MASKLQAAITKTDAQQITEKEYEQIAKRGFKVTDDDGLAGLVTKHVKETYQVPYVEDVREPITKKIPHRTVEKKVVKGTELVPVQKYRDVIETTIEYKKEKVKDFRTVWKPVKEEYEREVERPIEKRKVTKVPYTDYEEKAVERIVEVPVGYVEEQQTGTQSYKRAGTKLVELQGEEQYRFGADGRPELIGRSGLRLRELKDGDYSERSSHQSFNLGDVTRKVARELATPLSSARGGASRAIAATPRGRSSELQQLHSEDRHASGLAPGSSGRLDATNLAQHSSSRLQRHAQRQAQIAQQR